MPTCFKFIISVALFAAISASVLRADEPVELTITPRAVEQPLLKYRMFPAEFELKDGNAAPVLLRMIWDQKPYITSIYGTKKIDDALAVPLDDPQIIENGTLSFDGFYRYLKDASYLRSADWEYPLLGESPMAYIWLPDVQGAREMVGKGLSVWIRYQIAEGEIDQAREGIGVGLAVSRHYARTPFIIIQLATSSLNSMMLDRTEELISQPECPNLYWSLTVLPRPLLDSQSAVELEERMFELSLVGLDQLDMAWYDDPAEWNGNPAYLRRIRKDELDHLDDPRTQEEWDALARAIIHLLLEPEKVEQKTIQAERTETLIIEIAHNGRLELSGEISGGASRIQKMSDAEVAVRWFATRHRAISQEITALMSLPPQQALPVLRVLQTKIKTFREENGLKTLYNLENPLNLYVALRRNDRRIAMLRIIEGLRHYAATHEGRLPHLLVDLKETPAPHDPLLEKPFQYEYDGETATLTAPGIDVGDTKLAEYIYKIKVRKP